MSGFSALAPIKTITSLLPLNGFVEHAVVLMEIDGSPDEMNETHIAVFSFLEKVIPK